MPFLTDLDSRAEIKGSRDPLGLVPVWSRFGRKVVGNLSTVSNSVRGFTTLLLGYYFAEEAREAAHDQKATLDTFLKFEQLASYSRLHCLEDRGFRGVERVAKRLSESRKVTLGTDTNSQILSNQKIYGIWGLFSVPARASGILQTNSPTLSPHARAFVEKTYIAPLKRNGGKVTRQIADMLRRTKADLFVGGRDAALVKAIAELHTPALTAAEVNFYHHHLVNGGDTDSTDGCQPELARLLRTCPSDTAFGVAELRAVIKAAGKAGGNHALADRLEQIRILESLLIPMTMAFSFMLSRNRQTLQTIAGEIRGVWGKQLAHVDPTSVEALRPSLLAAFQQNDGAADRFIFIAKALAGGEYTTVLEHLLAHNLHVMQERNGSQPWAHLTNGKLDVRYHDETTRILSGDELPELWRNTYFINSLHQVVVSVGAAA